MRLVKTISLSCCTTYRVLKLRLSRALVIPASAQSKGYCLATWRCCVSNTMCLLPHGWSPQGLRRVRAVLGKWFCLASIGSVGLPAGGVATIHLLFSAIVAIVQGQSTPSNPAGTACAFELFRSCCVRPNDGSVL